MNTPYGQFERNSLILRDYLATDRTDLAIDRTMLSYVRTALTFLIAGVSFIKFFDTAILTVVGWLFVVATPLFLLIGIWRAFQMKKVVASLKLKDEKELDLPSDSEGLSPSPVLQQA